MSFYNEILTEHNARPLHKRAMEDATASLEGVNPSCGDDIVLYLKTGDGKVLDASFDGDGCAISQASADIMCDMLIGRTVAEGLELAGLFRRMLVGEISPEELDRLEEAGILRDVSHMPSRVKCAVLGWRTFEEMAEKGRRPDFAGLALFEIKIGEGASPSLGPIAPCPRGPC